MVGGNRDPNYCRIPSHTDIQDFRTKEEKQLKKREKISVVVGIVLLVFGLAWPRPAQDPIFIGMVIIPMALVISIALIVPPLWRLWRLRQDPCLTEEEICLYFSGLLSSQEKLALNRHMQRCSSCKDRMFEQPEVIAGARSAVDYLRKALR